MRNRGRTRGEKGRNWSRKLKWQEEDGEKREQERGANEFLVLESKSKNLCNQRPTFSWSGYKHLTKLSINHAKQTLTDQDWLRVTALLKSFNQTKHKQTGLHCQMQLLNIFLYRQEHKKLEWETMLYYKCEIKETPKTKWEPNIGAKHTREYKTDCNE